MNTHFQLLRQQATVDRTEVTGSFGETWIVCRCAWALYNFRSGLIFALRAADIPVVAMGAGGDGFEPKLQDAGIVFEPLPIDKRGLNPIADLRLFWELCKRMRQKRPALVHLFNIKPVIWGGLAARVTGIPAVVTVTGLGHVFTSGSPLLRWIVEFLYRRALKGVEVVFFQNKDDRELFLRRKLVREHQARLVPGSGVDIHYFNFVAPRERVTIPTFLMVARLLREKGVVEYLEAARRLRNECPGVRCLLVGEPDIRNPSALRTTDVLRLAAAAGVEWRGGTNDVRPWLSQADVVVLPSYREGIPRSLLEAAAMGRALITTDTAGCREVVDPEVTGLLVPVRDVDGLVAAMKRFVEQPELAAKFGGAGRTKVIREFDESHVIDLTFQAYRDLGVVAERKS